MKQLKRVKKVLQILPDFGYGGIESFILSYYKYIDKNEILFDFMCFGKKYDFHEKIQSRGSHIYYMQSLSEVNVMKYCFNIYKVIKNGGYTVIHSNMNYLNGIILIIARICKIKIRISHAHSTNFLNKKVKYFLPMLRKLIVINSNKLLACSEEAGKFLYKDDKFSILPNAIELKEFKKRELQNDLSKLSESLNIPKNSTVLGNVARFSPEKNHIFFVNLVKQLIKKDPNIVLVLVGDGPLKSEIEEVFIQENLMNYVRFTGLRNDVPILMHLFDIFLLPSIFEGLGIVAIEAQAAGTPCILSDTITTEVDMHLGIVEFSALNNVDDWVNAILNRPKSLGDNFELIKNALDKNGYDINNSVHLLIEIYNSK